MPLDILTKCHHKIWKCHQQLFHTTSHVHYGPPGFNHITTSIFQNVSTLFVMVPLDTQPKCHHKIWKCHQPFFHKPLHSHAHIQHQFSAKWPSVCFCKWSQTFFNGASRHPDKMPPQDLKMPSAIFPQTSTSHALIQHQFSAKCHQCVSANDPRLFLMVPLDILTKCHHKIWKCHQPLFYKPLH